MQAAAERYSSGGRGGFISLSQLSRNTLENIDYLDV